MVKKYMDTTIKTADERFAHIIQDEEEMLAYDRYMKAACDRTSEINYARNEGREEGLEEGRLVIARNLLAKGSTVEFVHEITGLSLETIEKL